MNQSQLNNEKLQDVRALSIYLTLGYSANPIDLIIANFNSNINMANPYEKFLSVEDTEHVRVVNYVKDKLPDIICLHTPNEGGRSSYERFKISKMGIVTGFPDFAFFYPKYDNSTPKELMYHGLAIELKAPEHKRIVTKGVNSGKIVKAVGKLSDAQKDVIEKLNKSGYKAVCCFGYDEAIVVINEYFKDYLQEQKEIRLNRFKMKK